MGGVGDKLPLPFQIINKRTNGTFGQKQHQDKNDKDTGKKHENCDAQHIINRLKLEKTVRHDNGASAILIWKDAETIMVRIPMCYSGVYNPADSIHHYLAVQCGNMIQINGRHFFLRCQLHDEIPDFKGGFRCNLKIEIGGIKMRTGRKVPPFW